MTTPDQYCPVKVLKLFELSFYSNRINVVVNVFDFNFFSPIGHNLPITDRKGVASALRANHFLSVDELFPETRIRQMSSPVSRRTSDSKLFVFRSIPLHGLRSTDLSGESSRYRNMPAGHAAQTLSCRGPEQSFSKHIGRCKRKTGLAHLRRLCSCVDPNRQRVVCGRGLRAANHPGCLRSGFHHDRSVSLPFSVGLFSATQKRHQTPYRNGSARLYSFPNGIGITHGKVHDVIFLDQLVLEPAAFYIMDRGYIDFARLYRFTQNMAFFVTRAKSNLDYIRRSSHSIDPGAGL